MNEPAVRVAFIGGIGRSGSTLLELLLASRGDMCAVGETVHLWQRGVLDNERCACGEPFSRCPFWSAVGDHAFGGWTTAHALAVLDEQAAVDRTRYVPTSIASSRGSPRRIAVEAYGSAYRAIYRAALEQSGALLVLDSSKHVSLAAALSMTSGIDLRIVHIVRDPRAVAYSWTRRVERPESSQGERMATASPARIAARWNLQNGLFSLVARRAPVYRVRYEDLASSPAAVVRSIREYLGAPEAIGDDFPREPQVIHSVAGNPIRFSRGPLNIKPDTSWRCGLRTRDRLLVEGITFPLARRYW